MDLTTYTGLQAAVADFLNRDDLNTDGQIAAFIALAEATMRRRLRRTTKTATLTVESGEMTATLPSDCAELKSIALAPSAALPRGGMPLAEVSYSQLSEARARYPATGVARVFAVVGSTVHFAPAPLDGYHEFDISYLTGFTPLSASVPSNSILAEAPDAYLYGALVESAPYLEHDERLPVWRERFDRAIDELNEKRQREEFGASLTRARLPVVFG